MSSEQPPPPTSTAATSTTITPPPPSSTLNTPSHNLHISYLQLALTEAKKCIPTPTAFCVGAALVDPSTTPPTVLSTGYSRELPGNTHAEQCALDKYDQERLLLPSSTVLSYNTTTTDDGDGNEDDDLILYTTMEPCSERLSGNLPCVDRILQWQEVRQQQHQEQQAGRGEGKGEEEKGQARRQQQEEINSPSTLTKTRRIKTVYVGVREPETFIKKNVAWEKLKAANVKYIHVPGLEKECLEVAERGH